MSEIRFGTEGWIGRIGKELTFHNVRIFTQGYANYLKAKNNFSQLAVMVNYDARGISKKLAMEAVNILSLNGIKTYFTTRDIPIPAVSLSVRNKKLSGALNFTGGLKDLHYNGIKILNEKGILLMPSESTVVEKEIKGVRNSYKFKPQYPNEDRICTVDFSASYLKYLETIIDFEIIKKSKIKVIMDNLYGSTRDYTEELLSRNGLEIMSVHNFSDPSFGGGDLCLNKESMAELTDTMKKYKGDIGLGLDINGEHCVIMDAGGELINNSIFIPLLLEYLIKIRKKKGGIVKSVISTINIDKVAGKYKREIYESPVGFKYLSDFLYHTKAFIAVEDCGSISLNKKVKINDGVLTGLLFTEMIAYYNCTFAELAKRFGSEYTRFYQDHTRKEKTEQREKTFTRLLADKKIKLKGLKIKSIKRLDGIKFNLENSWFLIREASGGNYYKIYAEADSKDNLAELLQTGEDLIG